MPRPVVPLVVAPLLAASLLLAASACALADGDILERKDGKFLPAIKGDRPGEQDFKDSTHAVKDATADVVTYTFGEIKALQSMPAGEIAEIHLRASVRGTVFRGAEKDMAQGNYADAAETFQKVGADPRAHPVVRQRALFNVALCRMNGGDAKGAVEAVEALLSTYSRSFYLKRALLLKVQANLESGDEAEGKKGIEQLLALPGLGESDRLDVTLARINIDFNRAANATPVDRATVSKCREEYDRIVQQTAGKAEFSAVSNGAQIGSANCLLRLGEADKARAVFQRIAYDSKADEGLLARAFNGLGECFYGQNNPEALREARRCFLRVRILYQDAATPNEVAKALYYAGQCFKDLGDLPPAALKDAIRREWGECVQRFPKSIWALRCKQGR